jgi:hypothetical protein
VSAQITLQVDEIPEVKILDEYSIEVNGWIFDHRDGVTTAEDVAAFAAAKTWYEQHPEAVPDE